MLLVKKYPNRRLYDTRSSRYITLEDLEKTIRGGEDVAVQDAQNGRDLTQETLTQIILDRGGGRILPSQLLIRLIRLDDAGFAEFLTRYVSWALEVYVSAKDRARSFLPINPLATAPFAATDALARMVLGWGSRNEPAPAAPAMPVAFDHENGAPPEEPEIPPPPSVEPVNLGTEMERLRHEIEALKASLQPASKPKKKKRAAKRA